MCKIQTLSLNVIKQLAERELSEINGTPLVTIISLNVFNNDDDDYDHLYVNADLDNADDEECDGHHPWALVWDSDEDMFVTVMRLDQNEDDDEDEDEEHSKLFYVWLYEGGDDGADDAGKDSFKDYDDAVAYADAFVKDCDVVGKFVDDGNYIWNLNKGERIAIVRNYDNDDLYMTDICTVK